MALIKRKVLLRQPFTNYTFLARQTCNIRLYNYVSVAFHGHALIYTVSQGSSEQKTVLMVPAVDLWKEREMAKTKKKYEKLSEKIMLWENKKKKKAKRKLHRTERSVEKTKLKAMQRFGDDNERIEIIVANARAHAYESQMKEELKVREKANLMRTTGRSPSTCL